MHLISISNWMFLCGIIFGIVSISDVINPNGTLKDNFSLKADRMHFL